MYRTVEYENREKKFGELSSATLPGVTDMVAALGVPSHGLWRNALKVVTNEKGEALGEVLTIIC